MRPAGGDWAEPDDLSEAGQDAGEPSVAMDEAGEAVAVWTRLDGSDTIQAAVRPAGGDWAEPDDLSDAGQNAAEPGVAIDEAGEAVAVWRRFNGSNDIVQAAVRPAGGEWSDPDDLSASGQKQLFPGRGDECRGRCGGDVVPLRRRQLQGPGNGAPARRRVA